MSIPEKDEAIMGSEEECGADGEGEDGVCWERRVGELEEDEDGCQQHSECRGNGSRVIVGWIMAWIVLVAQV